MSKGYVYITYRRFCFKRVAIYSRSFLPAGDRRFGELGRSTRNCEILISQTHQSRKLKFLANLIPCNVPEGTHHWVMRRLFDHDEHGCHLPENEVHEAILADLRAETTSILIG